MRARRVWAILLLALVAGCDSAEESFSRVDVTVGRVLRYDTRFTANARPASSPVDVSGSPMSGSYVVNCALEDADSRR